MKIRIYESGEYSRTLKRALNRDAKLRKILEKQIKIFRKDPNAKILKNHKLSKKMQGKHAFSVTGDIRIVYRKINKHTVRFLAIGSHPEVYRKN